VTPREYKLFLTRSQKLVIVLPAVMMVLVAVVVTVVLSAKRFPQDDASPLFDWFPIVFVAIFVGLYLSNILTLPYQITVTRDAQLVFKSVIRSRSVKARDVLAIEPRQLNIQAGISGYVLKHREGKFRFPGQFTDQYRLLYELKEANPAVELKGC
jgi:hypothetical protein